MRSRFTHRYLWPFQMQTQLYNFMLCEKCPAHSTVDRSETNHRAASFLITKLWSHSAGEDEAKKVPPFISISPHFQRFYFLCWLFSLCLGMHSDRSREHNTIRLFSRPWAWNRERACAMLGSSDEQFHGHFHEPRDGEGRRGEKWLCFVMISISRKELHKNYRRPCYSTNTAEEKLVASH